MEAIQVERQRFGFGRTSTFLQLTMPPSDGAVRGDTLASTLVVEFRR